MKIILNHVNKEISYIDLVPFESGEKIEHQRILRGRLQLAAVGHIHLDGPIRGTPAGG